MWQVESDLCTDPDFRSKRGASVYAYTTRDSTRVRFDGRAWLRSDDTVIFDTSERAIDAPLEAHLDTRFVHRRSDLLTIEYRKPDAVANSFLAGFCSAVLVFGIWLWIEE